MKLEMDNSKLISQKGYNIKNIALLLFVIAFLGGQIFWLRQNIYASVLAEQGLDQQTVDQPIDIVLKQTPISSSLVLIDEPDGNVWETVQVQEIVENPTDISTNTTVQENVLPLGEKETKIGQENTNPSIADKVVPKETPKVVENIPVDKKEVVNNVKPEPKVSTNTWSVDPYLYKYPYTQALSEVSKMVEGSEEKNLIAKLTSQPQSMWFGDWHSNIEKSVGDFVSSANKESKLPVLVLYNIPKRDCFGYSGGGAESEDAYRNWINAVKKGLAGHKAMIILEPDAVAGSDCLSMEDRGIRYDLIKYGVEQLSSNSVSVYIDAGHSNWVGADDMAQRLTQSGISSAKGFSLNVSNFYTNDSLVSYGRSLNEKLGGGKTFVIDTSRNGNGPTKDFQWCNPPGMALGNLPTLNTGVSGVDAFLWIKAPGESDGTCNGGPKAGAWWLDYALELVRNSRL
jgi:endoglucanase